MSSQLDLDKALESMKITLAQIYEMYFKLASAPFIVFFFFVFFNGA